MGEPAALHVGRDRFRRRLTWSNAGFENKKTRNNRVIPMWEGA